MNKYLYYCIESVFCRIDNHTNHDAYVFMHYWSFGLKEVNFTH